MSFPQIIQGGMGVAVSNWRLARAVSQCGQLGVISGTAMDVVLARRLQLGDVGGHMRRAIEAFPIPEIAERVWSRFFQEEGKDDEVAFRSKPMPDINPSVALEELIVVSNFAEVWLAKEGHDGVVGINLLEKIQAPTVPSLFGAMLAGVDYVLMGAGIPRYIPGVLDRLAEGNPAELRIDVAGTLPGEEFFSRFDPRPWLKHVGDQLVRPKFLAIISSATLALSLHKKASGKVDGFVVEGKTAGGHNAPPRGAMQLDENGEPIYGPRDEPSLEQIRDIGLPFWLAGSYAEPEKLREAWAVGAQGIQVGTAFAFCDESGIETALKQQVLEKARRESVDIFTDPLCSPTGFPFKVVQVEGTMSANDAYQARTRICDLGYLRSPYRKEDGSIGYRCAAEPIADFERKGGDVAETVGRKCVCNGLMATVGLGQRRKDGRHELPLITAGDDVKLLARFVRGRSSYTAAEVIAYLLAEPLSAPTPGSGTASTSTSIHQPGAPIKLLQSS